jgi:hypothetical protein
MRDPVGGSSRPDGRVANPRAASRGRCGAALFPALGALCKAEKVRQTENKGLSVFISCLALGKSFCICFSVCIRDNDPALPASLVFQRPREKRQHLQSVVFAQGLAGWVSQGRGECQRWSLTEITPSVPGSGAGPLIHPCQRDPSAFGVSSTTSCPCGLRHST